MAVLDWLQQLLGGGQYGDPSVPAMSTAPLEGAQGYTADVLQHLQDVIVGKVAAGGALAQSNYDPRASFAQNALNPAGIEQATDMAFGIGPGAIRAWHASPYDFEKFDISKVGTGQGAQSYGHGIYAAESPAVSGKGGQYDLEFTAKNLGKYDLNPGEWQIHRMLRADRSDMDILGELAKGGGYTFDEAIAALDRVKAAKAKIYEVDIHADPKTFLDWDKPLGKQSSAVQEKLRPGLAPYMTMQPMGTVVRQAGESPYAASLLFNREARPLSLTPAEVSARLRDLGIPGSRYLDQGSRGAGTGTSNYAVFDDSLIEILRKYGILPPLAAGGGLLAAGQEPPT
jgi:hypothetical protein